MSDTTAKLIMLYLLFLPVTMSHVVAVSIYTLVAVLLWLKIKKETQQ